MQQPLPRRGGESSRLIGDEIGPSSTALRLQSALRERRVYGPGSDRVEPDADGIRQLIPLGPSHIACCQALEGRLEHSGE